jgi:hypothetical protein
VKLPLSYIAGLYDGDGSFTLALERHPAIPSGYQIQPTVSLGLASYDSTVFNDIIETFSDLKFTIIVKREGTSILRLRREEDVCKFLGMVRPYLRIFTNVRRAEIMHEVVEFILKHRRGRHYGSDEFFDYLKGLIVKMRTYSKRVPRSRKSLEVVKDVQRLKDESRNYTPPPFNIEYVAGLFDAEGYVGLIKERHPRSLLGFLVYPIVNLNLAIYDSSVLVRMKEMFSYLNPQLKFREQNNTAFFQISGISHVKEFLTILYPHLRLPTKRKRVEIVLKVIDFMEKGYHKTERGKLELLKFINELRRLAKRRQRNIL